ncbi:hypothetical protein BJV74DRAFT_907472 [Russula compacta]|nr:hypothetical protein BJV74DRAFT_907472 [Russula compacta]
MQHPAARPGVELESAMEGLDISRGHRDSPPQPRQPQAQAQTSRAVKASHGEVWYLKSIDFTSPSSGEARKYNVITQNYNGPCSDTPPDRKTVSYDFLAQLVGEHILLTAPDVDASAALSMMPLTTRGMDLNPVFTSPITFRPATTGGELALFASAGITLVHGWLVDTESPEHAAVSRVEDYDSAMNLIVEADDGEDDTDSGQAGPSNPNMNLTDEESRKVADAVAIRTFLDNTRSQLTYSGLFTLASLTPGSAGQSKPLSTSKPISPPSPSDDLTTTEPIPQPPHPELFALFRNSHLAVLYRHPGALYTLVTDQVFLNEPSVVWERLEDVDQGAAVFVDAAFERATPIGGDWAGWNPNSETLGTVDPVDRALALELQNEEDEKARRAYAQREQQKRRELAERNERRWEGQRQDEERKKEKKDCVIM